MATTDTNILQASGAFDPASSSTELHLADGRVLRFPTSLLTAASLPPESPEISPLPETTTVIPIIEEQLNLSKRTVPTAHVRIEKTVEAFEAKVAEPLTRVAWQVDRVPMNLLIEEPTPVRVEGSTTIYPVFEEQLVVTKQLILREEIRVTREESQFHNDQTVMLRREHLTVTRDPSS